MTDDEIERFVMAEIKKSDITFYDMIGLPNCGVDPDPEDKITPPSEKGIRHNRFTNYFGDDKMRELLCVGQYNEWNPYPPLKISFQDLFRFWWSRCVEQELVVDEILEDLFEYFTELMRPPEQKEEEEQMDTTIDFDQIPLFTAGLEQAA